MTAQELYVTYTHYSTPDGPRFRQLASDKLPKWANNIQVEKPVLKQMKTSQELAAMLETGSGLVRSQLLEAAAMLLQQAEQIDAQGGALQALAQENIKLTQEIEVLKAEFVRQLDKVSTRNYTLRKENKALKADAERLDLLESTFFAKRWNGVMDSGSRTTWCIVPGYQHSTHSMVGHTFRAAIDAMRKAT